MLAAIAKIEPLNSPHGIMGIILPINRSRILKSKFPFLSGLLSAALALAVALAAFPAAAETRKTNSYTELFQLNPQASYILVFAFPSSAWLDWSSPSRLARTTVQSQIARRLYHYPSSIGHAQIAWSCQMPDGTVQKGATGQTGEEHNQGLSSLLQGWGMSLLELVYPDGHLESEAEVEQRLQTAAKANQFSWVGFQVKPTQCQRLVEFVKAYEKAGAAINYGFPVDPLLLQGGGCTSFANAAVEKAGIPFPLRRYWTRKYDIPLHHMGRQTALPAFTQLVPQARVPQANHSVSLTDFLWGEVSWARAGEPAVPFTYYDPELFYENFLHLENAHRQQLGLKLKPPVRTASYDEFQQPLKVASEAWMQQLQQAGTPLKLGMIHQTSGLMVDLSQTP